MKSITLPQLRQTYGYDCGAKAIQTVLVYYGIELREDHILKTAGTTKNGTQIKGIIKVAEKNGLKTDSREMSIGDIKDYIDKKIPVILALQAWTAKKKVDWKKDWIDGHYVVAIGYTKDKILFEDPSSFERTYLKYNELEKRWHDMDIKGKKYDHHGIAVFGKKPKFDKDKLKHMR
ncbi:MAG: cysteine peptidase family C39 domain-containing protein [Patescibacteria group bacterium]|jgi:ABC-type bacteriocin/lantibiotic exporter with double-glycine peptidase domain